ncbi:ribonuclease P protein subunit p29 isoform X2 [Dendrobium catenatum]|uniref:ribonuclease P protein subunit p29 isoform X2 n=1 Tax=Dendrobium catenatum TaxID=906689 RepID=UPI0010A00105|nr:ribonuclease P protein subunit p29 isoform X2 [Dendrobium catenatum]
MESLKVKSTKKGMGYLKFSGKASQRHASLKTDADFHPVYSELLEGINDKLLNSESENEETCKQFHTCVMCYSCSFLFIGEKIVSNKADIVNKVVYDILQHGEEWNKFRRTSLKKKIDHCLLLDNFVPNVGVSMDARAKALRSHSKRSQKHMSLRQHRKCGTFDMPKELHKFELFKPMHDMWKAYILELLEESSKKQLAQCLLTADLHGAFVVVVECKTRSFVGISGIMIRETAETFGIIKQDNHFRVVPKHGSVFIFQAGCWKVTLHGDKLSLRNIT